MLASGREFLLVPAPQPGRLALAYTCWDHPNMPWDGTELWVAPLDRPDGGASSSRAGRGESIWQPEWDAGGRLHWVSDRTGWWQLYREGEQLTTEDGAEVGYPQWLFGGSTYAFLAGGEIAAIRTEGGEERLAPGARRARSRTSGCRTRRSSGFRSLRAHGDELLFVGGEPRRGGGARALERRRGRARSCAPPGSRSAAGLDLAPRRLDFPDQRRRHRARVLLPAGEPGLRRRPPTSDRR